MGKRSEQTFYKDIQMTNEHNEDTQYHSYQKNAKKNHNEIPLHTHWDG